MIQEPGMMVVTHPNGYHGGFNCGVNVNEAVNALFTHGIDYVINDKHCGCPSEFKLVDTQIINQCRPSLKMLTERKRSNPDDPKTIKRKKQDDIEKMEGARARKSEIKNRNPRTELTDIELERYLKYIMAYREHGSVTPKIHEITKYRLEHKKEITDDSKNWSLATFQRVVDSTVSKCLGQIIEKPYFNEPGKSEILTFLKAKQKKKKVDEDANEQSNIKNI